MLKKIIAIALMLVSTISFSSSKNIQLTKDNTIVFRGVVDGATVSKAQSDLLALHLALPKGKPIYLFLDTPGGSIESGMEFINFAKSLDREVKTITSFAASMGFVMAQQLGERLILPGGILMSHRATIGLEGQIPGEFNTRSNFFLKLVTREEETVASRLEMSHEEYAKLIHDEYWTFGQSAVDENAADKVVQVTCSEDLLKTSHVETVRVFVFSVKVKFSDCPLIHSPLGIDKSSDVLTTLYPYEAAQVDNVLNELFTNRVNFVKEYITTGKYRKYFDKGSDK
jgi:ATP-dependent protease ClpP protease subunit